MYFYHGYALGVGSTVKDQEDQQFTEPVSALSVRGGKASADSNNFNKFGIQFSAHVEVSGWAEKRNGFYVWVTEASSTVTNLKIKNRAKTADVVTADSIEGHVRSEYRSGDYEASTVVTGSKFDNLQINGVQVTPVMSEDLSERFPTYSAMQSAFQNKFDQPQVLNCLVGRNLEPKTTDPSKTADTQDLVAAFAAYNEQVALTGLKSAVICSLVDRVDRLPAAGATNCGNIIRIPKFGRVYLGEVIVWPWMRCITMFRIEVEDNTGQLIGSISGGSVGANGTGFPPGAAPGGDWP